MTPHRTTLGSECNLTGDLVFKGEALFLGRLDGTLRADGPIEIGSGATVRGIVDADAVRLAGRIEGQLVGRQRVTLLGGSHVIGQVNTARFEVAPGARFEGVVSLDTEHASAYAAPPTRAQDDLDREEEDFDDPDAVNVILQRRRVKPRRHSPGVGM